jgi:chromosome segregation ATPase
MDQDSLAPLIEFIGKKFDEVDHRLDQMVTREERQSQLAETRRHFNGVAERMESQVRLVAEGVAGVSERLERRFQEVTAKIEEEAEETRAMIRVSYAQLDGRIRSLEGEFASLAKRVEQIEARIA